MYTAQLAVLPPAACKAERHALGRLLRLPGSALPRSQFFVLQAWHGPKFSSMTVVAEATVVRAALSTVPRWRTIAQEA
eukprot:10547002-Alexandrium_andersonii.AAC.1